MATAPAPDAARLDPHDPEDAAALVVDELVADRVTDDGLFEEAEQAARDVEEEEDAQ